MPQGVPAGDGGVAGATAEAAAQAQGAGRGAPGAEEGPARRPSGQREFTAAELGAIAHLYRAEIYRSTTWRTRLDTTTNWSVVTLGVALSITFAAPEASPLPLVLVGVLILLFLALEARRYLYFNVWRARSRWMETHLYAPMLHDGNLHLDENWQEVLAQDYWAPGYHISFMTAFGRRIRRNYLWILIIQSLAFLGKITVHPKPLESVSQLWDRAAVGPVPGVVIIGLGLLYVGSWCGIAIWSAAADRRKFGGERSRGSMG
ncbi:DUF2270 domain-containing protein [Paroceanicella profunda]|uniref:DUF2270 domain-containing protein n=1 Tax=Paroceanicella profunda TaxID=2579971 RepID=A0A5B8FZ50_9RHOB|nr:DUF2270 domain-containing protein [Paroceanicella profunda]